MHSDIERKLKGQSIFIPTDYVKIYADSRIDPAPYNVKYMRLSDFLNFSMRRITVCFMRLVKQGIHV